MPGPCCIRRDYGLRDTHKKATLSLPLRDWLERKTLSMKKSKRDSESKEPTLESLRIKRMNECAKNYAGKNRNQIQGEERLGTTSIKKS